MNALTGWPASRLRCPRGVCARGVCLISLDIGGTAITANAIANADFPETIAILGLHDILLTNDAAAFGLRCVAQWRRQTSAQQKQIMTKPSAVSLRGRIALTDSFSRPPAFLIFAEQFVDQFLDHLVARCALPAKLSLPPLTQVTSLIDDIDGWPHGVRPVAPVG